MLSSNYVAGYVALSCQKGCWRGGIASFGARTWALPSVRWGMIMWNGRSIEPPGTTSRKCICSGKSIIMCLLLQCHYLERGQFLRSKHELQSQHCWLIAGWHSIRESIWRDSTSQWWRTWLWHTWWDTLLHKATGNVPVLKHHDAPTWNTQWIYSNEFSRDGSFAWITECFESLTACTH